MTLPGAAAWTVMATPGHTDDHIALWNSESRSLLSGDAVIAVRGRPRFSPDTVDDMAAADTRRRLIELPVDIAARARATSAWTTSARNIIG